ncbi:MAG: hypothetical protein K2H72_05615, partial [Muribaculaceae bacterium]|nr:hypothetical protein [Muribaculaceae bacterium]
MPAAAREATSKERVRLEGLATTLKMASQVRIQKEHPMLESIGSSIRMSALSVLERENNRLDALKRLTDALNPSSTLKRGYSITRINGKAVIDTGDIRPGDILETQ